MKQKAHIHPAWILMLAVIVLLLSILPAQPVDAGGGVVLRPPFNGTYRVTAYFDHDKPTYCNGANNTITIYNGESVSSNCSAHTGEPYPYDGHDGWDFSMGTGTDVLAAAAGEVAFRGDLYGNTIIIAHDNNYYTQYSHLASYLVNMGDIVSAGQHIAESGSTGTTAAHLHFTVSHGGHSNTIHTVDPFGWRGSQRDPLFNYNSKESSCLWAGAPGANISCADFIVEDDGAGWSQDPAPDDACSDSLNSWARCDRGNGFRYHWTYVYNPADFWAKWTPTLPHQGYYQIQAFIPAENVKKPKTTNARYEIHRLSGTTIVPINQNNSPDAWASLGTFYLQSPSDYVQLYDYTGEASLSRSIAADSMKFSASIVHLPYVKNTGGWVSTITVRNNSASTAQAFINYYSAGGALVSSQTRVIDSNEAETLTAPTGHDGSAVVVANQDVSVVVREEQNNELNVYNGILATGGSPGWEQAGATLYAPIIKNSWGGRSSRLFVFNTGQIATHANVQFYNASTGTPVGALGSYYLVPNGSASIAPNECPAGVLCSAKIASSNGQFLAASIREQTDSTTNDRTTHNAFSIGATSNFIPLVKKNWGGQSTSIAVMNLGTGTTTVSITCYPSAGNGIPCGTRSVPKFATAVFLMNGADGSGLPNNFVGSAVVSTSPAQPAATLIYESGTPYKLVTNAPLAGSTAAYPPQLYGSYLQNGQTWDTGISIQNVNSSNNANVTITYYHQNGTFAGSWSNTIGPYRTWILNYGSGNLPGPNFAGSAFIQSNPNQSIAALVNVAHTGSGDTKANYTVPNR